MAQTLQQTKDKLHRDSYSVVLQQQKLIATMDAHLSELKAQKTSLAEEVADINAQMVDMRKELLDERERAAKASSLLSWEKEQHKRRDHDRTVVMTRAALLRNAALLENDCEDSSQLSHNHNRNNPAAKSAQKMVSFASPARGRGPRHGQEFSDSSPDELQPAQQQPQPQPQPEPQSLSENYVTRIEDLTFDDDDDRMRSALREESLMLEDNMLPSESQQQQQLPASDLTALKMLTKEEVQR
jgi:hypothetical protein